MLMIPFNVVMTAKIAGEINPEYLHEWIYYWHIAREAAEKNEMGQDKLRLLDYKCGKN